MKLSTQSIIIALILSIVLFISGQYLWGTIFEAILPVVGDVKYYEASTKGLFINSLLISLTFALIPIATILIWKFAPVLNTQRRLLTVGIIILAMASAILIRRETVKYQAKHIQPTTILDYSDPANPKPYTIVRGIPVSTLHFELFALSGLLVGSVISFYTLRQRVK